MHWVSSQKNFCAGVKAGCPAFTHSGTGVPPVSLPNHRRDACPTFSPLRSNSCSKCWSLPESGIGLASVASTVRCPPWQPARRDCALGGKRTVASKSQRLSSPHQQSTINPCFRKLALNDARMLVVTRVRHRTRVRGIDSAMPSKATRTLGLRPWREAHRRFQEPTALLSPSTINHQPSTPASANWR
jgi:hypothetical protein